ncbi:UvrD-helicase domain-containing protein, partial [Candidatus Aerophobetes bacterium]|nr:UvrD-helicase domain-containing protein [Candidatus Aerophobetes bacterium]
MSSLEDKILEGLNEEQKEAVTFGEGPLLIVAGAGTGKTQVITRRIAYLIATKKAKPEEILALTFTEKAALEMEERVDMLVPYGYTEFWISTFHAFGDRILRENALEIGLPPDFQVLSVPEQIIFFQENLFNFPLSHYRPLGNPTRHIQAILSLISRAKDEDVT